MGFAAEFEGSQRCHQAVSVQDANAFARSERVRSTDDGFACHGTSAALISEINISGKENSLIIISLLR